MHGLTFETHYALVALTSMARQPTADVLKMREISEREQLPAPFLSKILLKLRHAGVVRARHGRGGGYVLARSPFLISVKDVLGAFRAESLAFDVTKPSIASHEDLVRKLGQLNDQIGDLLAQSTIGDLAGLTPESTMKREAPRQGSAAA